MDRPTVRLIGRPPAHDEMSDTSAAETSPAGVTGGFLAIARRAATVPGPLRGRRVASALALLGLIMPSLAQAQATEAHADSGDTAWMLVSAALVLLMTPGLALFYGGMVRRKNVLATLMYSHFALALVTIQWVLFGYSLTFGKTHHGLIGGFDYLLLNGVVGELKGSVPALAFMAFQMKFAIITPALISGAFVERMKFSAYVLFTLLWSTLVYDPIAHWVWAEGGWMANFGVLDFAGGTVVHWTAGVGAGLAVYIDGGWVRADKSPRPADDHRRGLLWFGWFGFNAGSAPAAGQTRRWPSSPPIAAAAAAMTWVPRVEFRRRPTPRVRLRAGGGPGGITPRRVSSLPGPVIIGALAGLAGGGTAQGAALPLRRCARRPCSRGGDAGRAPGRGTNPSGPTGSPVRRSSWEKALGPGRGVMPRR
jgi:Amt family ammonium transporter